MNFTLKPDALMQRIRFFVGKRKILPKAFCRMSDNNCVVTSNNSQFAKEGNMIPQDVADTSPVTVGVSGPNLFLDSLHSKNEFTPRPAPTSHAEKDLMFFMTRSYQALIYSDGGD
jgi:hypothetical protein